MATVVHEWGDRPIVTLVSEFASWETQWHGRTSQTFPGGTRNILKLLVEFKYKKPYGKSACYRVVIDRQYGTDWINAITDEIGFTDPNDNQWHTEYKEYQLFGNASPLYMVIDRLERFRITTQIEGPGCIGTGSTSGSFGFWSSPESKEFAATYKKPTLQAVEAHAISLQDALREGFQNYKNRPRR